MSKESRTAYRRSAIWISTKATTAVPDGGLSSANRIILARSFVRCCLRSDISASYEHTCAADSMTMAMTFSGR